MRGRRSGYGLLRVAHLFWLSLGGSGFGWGVFVGGLSRVKMHHVPFRELGWSGLRLSGFGLVPAGVNLRV